MFAHMYCCTYKRKRTLLGIGFLLLLWSPEVRLRPPGLYGRYFTLEGTWPSYPHLFL